MAAKIELKKSENGKYFFNLKAGNGEVILSGAMQETRAEAETIIKAVQERGGNDGNIERKTSKDGEPYFVLNNANSETLGRSEMYSSAAGMENGINSVARNAAIANFVDLTQ